MLDWDNLFVHPSILYFFVIPSRFGPLLLRSVYGVSCSKPCLLLIFFCPRFGYWFLLIAFRLFSRDPSMFVPCLSHPSVFPHLLVFGCLCLQVFLHDLVLCCWYLGFISPFQCFWVFLLVLLEFLPSDPSMSLDMMLHNPLYCQL